MFFYGANFAINIALCVSIPINLKVSNKLVDEASFQLESASNCTKVNYE
jgi:hypothetical protein